MVAATSRGARRLNPSPESGDIDDKVACDL